MLFKSEELLRRRMRDILVFEVNKLREELRRVKRVKLDELLGFEEVGEVTLEEKMMLRL